MRQHILAWLVDTDPPQTRRAYRNLQRGAAKRCGCLECRNFDAARPAHFPTPLLELLDVVAADPRKETAVSYISPLEENRSLYAGNYVFCGHMLAGRPHRGFPFLTERVDVFEEIDSRTHVALRPVTVPEGVWSGLSCVRLEFLVVLPWVLGEPPVRGVNLDRGRGNVPS